MGGDSETRHEQVTETTNTQDIDSTTTGLEDVEFGVVGGGDVSIVQQEIDPGAFELGETALHEGFGFGETALTEALEFGQASQDAAAAASNQALATLGKAITSVSDASRSDTTDAFRRIAIPAIIGITIVFAIVAYRRK